MVTCSLKATWEMNRGALIFLVVLILISCKEVSFKEPQPKGRRTMTSVPKKLQGKYLTYEENGVLSKDTVIIKPNGYRFGYFDPLPASTHREDYEEGVLSDSLILKSYKGYYFLNLYEKPEWLLRVIKQERNGDLIYMAMEQEDVDFNDYLKKLSSEIAIDSVKRENETLYHIDPSPAKLIELIENGYFTRTPLKRIH
jgi:hypothetical protein